MIRYGQEPKSRPCTILLIFFFLIEPFFILQPCRNQTENPALLAEQEAVTNELEACHRKNTPAKNSTPFITVWNPGNCWRKPVSISVSNYKNYVKNIFPAVQQKHQLLVQSATPYLSLASQHASQCMTFLR